MHIIFFPHKLPLLLFTFILRQHSFAASQSYPDHAVLKAVRDFTFASDSSSSSSSSNQGALLSLTPGPGNTAQNDDPTAAATTASLVSASKKECSSSTGGKTKTSENKRRRRSSGDSCGWDDNGKESGTELGTDYDVHIPDTFVDKERHQFFYPATLQEDPSICTGAPLLTPVCDDGSYMISQPDPRAPPSPFQFTLPFCRPRTFESSFSPSNFFLVVLLFGVHLFYATRNEGETSERESERELCFN